jgi:type IV pilus assembly protein PilY1
MMPKLFRAPHALGLLLITAFAWPFGASAVLTIPEAPIFQTSVGVPPNVLVTLDDSGSMQWAYMPDSQDNTRGTRRSKSSTFNPIYYNPSIVYAAPIGANGSALSTSFTCAYNNGFDTTRGCVNLSNNYRHTWYYNPQDAVYGSWDYGNPQNQHPWQDYVDTWSGTRAYYYIYNAGNAGCNGTTDDDDCYTRVVLPAAQEQNFANWYSFYRTRNLSTVSAASIAFGMFAPETRIAFQALSSCRGNTNTFVTNDCDGWTNMSPTFSNAIKPFGTQTPTVGTQRANFYKWLQRLPANSNTPLRSAVERAGAYLQTSGAQSPWDNALDDASNNNESVCRKSFQIVMTDGLWNSDYYLSFHNNKDGNSFTLGNGSTVYNVADPYSDNNWDSLADIAMHYWGTDLRPDLANEVPPYIADATGSTTTQFWNPVNDPATWQHMSLYTVGLGLGTALANSGLTWSGNMYGGSYPNIAANSQQWPAVSDGSANNVSDLWHAAINGRGRF